MMYKSEISVRVRYSETDKMGYVYYGNYAAYLEVARVEMLRELGLSYKRMEDEGVMLPVADFHIRYLRPAYYDDVITIKASIPKLPLSKIEFIYESFNQDGILLNTAETVLVFVDMASKKPCKAPAAFVERIAPFFSGSSDTKD